MLPRDERGPNARARARVRVKLVENSKIQRATVDNREKRNFAFLQSFLNYSKSLRLQIVF